MGYPVLFDGTQTNSLQSLADKLYHIHSNGLQFAAPDPQFKVNELDLVRGVLQMLQGLSGSLFFWDPFVLRFCIKNGVYLIHLSQTSLCQILGPLVYAATCLQQVENFVKKVQFTSKCAPPTLKAFAHSVSLWLKRLRDIVLKEEKNLVRSEVNSIHTLLGLGNALSSVCSGAEYLLQVVQGAIPSVYLDNLSEVPPSEITVHILDHLYELLNEICPVQGGEEDAYHMLLVLFVGCLVPYIEGLDSWLYDGTLDDPFEEMFFYANSAVMIDQPAYWEKSYLFRAQQYRKLVTGVSSRICGGESFRNNKRDIGDKGPTIVSGIVKGKDQHNIETVVCPLFLKDMTRSIVSAGKSLQLIRHAKTSRTVIFNESDDSGVCSLEALERSTFGSFDHFNFKESKLEGNDQYLGRLTLAEIFCISLLALISDGSHIYRHMKQEESVSLASHCEKMKLVKQSSPTQPHFVATGSIWHKFLDETELQKKCGWVDMVLKIKDSDSSVQTMDSSDEEYPLNARSFWPENPAITVCREFLHAKKCVSDEFYNRYVLLPPLNDEKLRHAIFSGENAIACGEMDVLRPDATNYTCGFQFDETEFARLEDERKCLKSLFPFPTLLPCFQEDKSISEVLPYQKNSTLASRVLYWIQSLELKTTPLPGVVLQECLIAYIKKQVDSVGRHILLKLMNGWKLMDELGVLRAIYLLGSGDLLQHFLIVLFDKLDKGDSWDDEFELNTVLQESIRNSADGMLLSAPDSLVVSIAKPQSPDDGRNMTNLVVGPRKSRHGCFGIDELDLLKFTYKVSWPLELIANTDAMKKYNQVMAFLLKVKRAKFVLDKARRWMWKDGSMKRINRKRHLLVEQKLLHFVDAFHQYVMDRVFHSAWLELFDGMASAGSLDEVIEVHEAYLLSIQRLCFVAHDKLWALIANRIKNILGLALEFYSIQQLLCSSAANSAIQSSCDNEVDRIEKQFDDCIVFLLRVLSFKLNVGHFPHLADLVTRINYNYFYMSDNGSVLTGAVSESNASKLGKTFMTRHDMQ
ncbi:hypothetical protein H6P81_020885 [Aristolochia fimbriata]|uniref:Gamma-tubulin complex component n=1 Tax=Aristolochia fimbriata TaxID=158543 RepID=A0AAV7DVP1_ARIFI|nr:hypothetical protein H6P81_020885 [Aristolochia fimbriata]